jgi:hypothetical protein
VGAGGRRRLAEGDDSAHLALTDDVIAAHLTVEVHVGLYPLGRRHVLLACSGLRRPGCDYHDAETGVLAASLAKRAPGYVSLGFPDPRRLQHLPPDRA